MDISLKPRHVRAFFLLSCIGGHRTERKLLGWSVGHLRLPTNQVQMTSLGPSRARGRVGALGRSAYSDG
jgi:hypothetical protein